MKIKCVGPADSVSLAPSAGGTTVRHREAVEVDDELARSLLEQGTFVKASASTPKGSGSAASSSRVGRSASHRQRQAPGGLRQRRRAARRGAAALRQRLLELDDGGKASPSSATS